MNKAILEFEPTTSSYTYSGLSEDAERLQSQVSWRSNRVDEYILYVDPYRIMVQEILDAANECWADDWDGYGCEGVDLSSVGNAANFVLALPIYLLPVEVGVDPDGEISLEWLGGNNSSVSISIGPNGELTYSGRYGRSLAYGVEHFIDEIPLVILENLSRIIWAI